MMQCSVVLDATAASTGRNVLHPWRGSYTAGAPLQVLIQELPPGRSPVITKSLVDGSPQRLEVRWRERAAMIWPV